MRNPQDGKLPFEEELEADYNRLSDEERARVQRQRDPDAELQLEGEPDSIEDDELELDADDLPLSNTKGDRHTG